MNREPGQAKRRQCPVGAVRVLPRLAAPHLRRDRKSVIASTFGAGTTTAGRLRNLERGDRSGELVTELGHSSSGPS